MIAALLPDLWPYIAGLLALIGAALGLYVKGRGDGKAKAQAKADKAQIKAQAEARETLERISNVPVLDADRSREWLHSRDPGTK